MRRGFRWWFYNAMFRVFGWTPLWPRMGRILWSTVAILAALSCLAAPAMASVASDAGTAVLEFAKDTILAPDTVGTSLGDPWTVDFSRKTNVTSVLPGLRDIDFYAGLSIASSGPALRGQSGIGITNIKGNRLSLIVVTAPYDEATWRIPLGNFVRLGLEPRVSLGRSF